MGRMSSRMSAMTIVIDKILFVISFIVCIYYFINQYTIADFAGISNMYNPLALDGILKDMDITAYDVNYSLGYTKSVLFAVLWLIVTIRTFLQVKCLNINGEFVKILWLVCSYLKVLFLYVLVGILVDHYAALIGVGIVLLLFSSLGGGTTSSDVVIIIIG